MSVSKKALERLSDSQLEKYILPDSKYITQAKVYAFEILKKRNRTFSPKEEERFAELIIVNSSDKTSESRFRTNITLSPFLITLGIIEVILFFTSITNLLIDVRGGRALAGSVALIGFIIFFFVLAIEQYVLRTYRFKKEGIWIVEFIILFGIAVFVGITGLSIG